MTAIAFQPASVSTHKVSHVCQDDCSLSVSTWSARQGNTVSFSHNSKLRIWWRVSCAGGGCRGWRGRHSGVSNGQDAGLSDLTPKCVQGTRNGEGEEEVGLEMACVCLTMCCGLVYSGGESCHQSLCRWRCCPASASRLWLSPCTLVVLRLPASPSREGLSYNPRRSVRHVPGETAT